MPENTNPNLKSKKDDVEEKEIKENPEEQSVEKESKTE